MRLFVALSLPETVQDRLSDLCQGVPSAKWVAADNLHLTLRFIGEVDHAEADDIHDALERIDCEAFDLDLVGLDTFGEGRKLRQLWVGVGENPALQRLQGKVEKAVQRAGQPPERRKFKPHVTLARFKSSPGPKLGEFIQSYGLLRIGPIRVADFVLYSSQLSPGGSIYREEARYPLSHLPANMASHPLTAGLVG